MKSQVKVVLRNPIDKSKTLDYMITTHDHQLSHDWIQALKKLLVDKKLLEKNYCFLGFPGTARNLQYLCNELNQSILIINSEFDNYHIDEYFTPDLCVSRDYADNGPNHKVLNQLHNHFERLQGTVWNLSDYYKRASYPAKYAIRQLNNICHEIENLVLSQRKAVTAPEWVRPSQITTWLNADRYALEDQHRLGFVSNGFDRVLGGVYMHWTQIGKTLFEVFRDEGAPKLNVGQDPTDITVGAGSTCEAITALKFYSGEFDVEWGNNVVYGGANPWHNTQQDQFRSWIESNGLDCTDPRLSLGYLPIGQVELMQSFGTSNGQEIWKLLENYLDIYQIEVDGIVQTFDYCWTDADYKQQQINKLITGYDHTARHTSQ